MAQPHRLTEIAHSVGSDVAPCTALKLRIHSEMDLMVSDECDAPASAARACCTQQRRSVSKYIYIYAALELRIPSELDRLAGL